MTEPSQDADREETISEATMMFAQYLTSARAAERQVISAPEQLSMQDRKTAARELKEPEAHYSLQSMVDHLNKCQLGSTVQSSDHEQDMSTATSSNSAANSGTISNTTSNANPTTPPEHMPVA
ncbi:hypothetical protein K505DRAFT_366332 [Melanomma pulvis-pyrius CBS 109.77]|uniref:Uncharacterized protein n=1 Tax=Melanomma pulvis-pyrius CBS 109.77 TaxID=1314802 RepID=A0A6A6WXD0_9PLEO|nr:hypothetical protein K505DRAFT_366332 [Melanomma pulvis-pyrius CBS 109.77]